MRTVVRGTCHHDCPDSCGWLVTVEERVDGPVAVRMGGNPDHPYSQGSLCPKVVPFLDRVYSSQRILEPLRRVGRKSLRPINAAFGGRPNVLPAEDDPLATGKS
jgi:anaerobic selenocysteine-containing dehydrogenase